MKSQTNVKLIWILILLAICLFACTTSPETQQGPTEKSTIKPTISKASPTTNNPPPRKTFSIQNASQVAPEDVMDEITFGGTGGGGGGVCENINYDYPVIGYHPEETDWLQIIGIRTCGWEAGEQVSVIVETPDNKVFTDTVEAQYDPISSVSFVDYEYQAELDSRVGRYIFKFEGTRGVIDVNVNVIMPNKSSMYFFENIRAYYLYGFVPNERIRFLWYEGQSGEYRFIGWEEYYVDENGTLLIEVPSDEGFYTAIGDKSGVVFGLDHFVLKDQSSLTSCSSILSPRLEMGKYAYVASDPPLDQRVRESAGKNYSIIGYISSGNPMKILDGPKCADGWTWWKVQSIKKPDLIGWSAEGDDVYWLIPCNSLSSCP